MFITGIFGIFYDAFPTPLDYRAVVPSFKNPFSWLLRVKLFPCVGYESRPQCTGFRLISTIKPRVIAAKMDSPELLGEVMLSQDLSESLPILGVFQMEGTRDKRNDSKTNCSLSSFPQKLLYSKWARGRGGVSGLLEFRPGDIPKLISKY